MIFRSLFPILLTALLAGCSVLELAAPAAPSRAPTETPAPTPAGTATIVWFPPSPTPLPPSIATHPPTPEMRPGVGITTLSDSFSDADLWETRSSDQATASVDRNRLTLAVQPGVYLFSLRRGLALDDFYAEITARLSLCRGADDYGLLIRASTAAYYRFSLTCSGMIQVDRISTGTRQSLLAALPSGDAPRGSPGEVRIGVWASGPEMRLFLNGRYQISITNPNMRTGTLGVFARSAGDTPLTVSFSDLTIQEVDYIPPTRTPSP